MARKRPSVPQSIKRELREQTGGKCANPGCMNRRLEDHHIKEWAVYETHDGKDMIAICPACHDAVHFGQLRIDDDRLREWKALKRYPVRHDVLTVEPGERPILYLGETVVESYSGSFSVFDFSDGNRLSGYVDANDFYVMDLTFTAPCGLKIVDMKQNRLVHALDPRVTYLRRPGRVVILAPNEPDFVPAWVEDERREYCRRHSIEFQPASRVVILDAEAVGPSEVRLQFAAFERDRAILALPKQLVFLTPGCPRFAQSIGVKPWDASDLIFGYDDPAIRVKYRRFLINIGLSAALPGK